MAISFSNNIKIQPITYQEFINSEYIPEYGEMVIISDYKQDENGINVPSFTVGDGSTMLKNLNISGEYVENANHSNTADDLGGREETREEQFTYQATANDESVKDGLAVVKSIKGNTVVTNQMFKENIKNPIAAMDISYDNGVFTINGSTNAINSIYLDQDFTQYEQGDKVLMLYPHNKPNPYGNFVALRSSSTFYHCPNNVDAYIITISTTEELRPAFICLSNKPYEDIQFSLKIINLTQMFGAGNEPTTVEEFERLYPNLPTEYNAGSLLNLNADSIKSVGFNQWDGEWEYGFISTGSGIKTKYNGVSTPTINNHRFVCKNYIKVFPNTSYYVRGENLRTGDALYIYEYTADKKFIRYLTVNNTTDISNKVFITSDSCRYILFQNYYESVDVDAYQNNICINLSHSGYRNGEYEPYKESIVNLPIKKYFPDGMKSAGAIKDEIVWDEGLKKYKAIKRVGSVDMGIFDIEVVVITSLEPVFLMRYAGMKNYAKVITPRYTSKSEMYDNITSQDKIISTIPFYSNGNIIIRDNDYTYDDNGLASFKQSLQGQILYYELETPIETIIDDYDLIDYEVSDFGTEEIIADEPTTPIIADIQYGFNAVDEIRDHRFAINKLKKSINDGVLTITQGEEILGEFSANQESNTTIELSKVATSGSYEDLSDKPSLNYLPLSGGTMTGHLNMGGKYITNGYMYETSLLWGDGHYQNKRIIDTLLTQPGNRFACTPASHIDVEYSRDNGETWLDYGLSDESKRNIFTLYRDNAIYLGKKINDGVVDVTNDRVRITWWSYKNDIVSFYGTLSKFLIKTSILAVGQVINTKISKLSKGDYDNNIDNWTTLYDVVHDGWPVERSYNFASNIHTANANTGYTWDNLTIALRFEFSYDSSSTVQTGTLGAVLYYIKGFGSTIYAHAAGIYGVPFNNQPFIYDSYQNTTFPAKVTSQEPINYDAIIKPTQTGNTVTKTNNWVLQYLTQGVHWLRDNKVETNSDATLTSLNIKGSANSTATITADQSKNLYVSTDGNIPFVVFPTIVCPGINNSNQISLGVHNQYWKEVWAGKYKIPGGTSSQFLKADGSVDSTSYATLDSTGKVPTSQLPSYVDDVEEYTNRASFPATGEKGKIYVDTTENDIYRWTGSTYIKISGIIGAQGEKGAQGYTGLQGATGLQGKQGLQGIKGTDGTNGTNGVQGYRGYQGYQGYQGYTGLQGATGLQGIKGTDGSRGVQGFQGIKGTDGSRGVQGFQGIKGTDGTNGTNGAQGYTGAQGYQGYQGIKGTDGSRGIQGFQGIKGTDGTNGTNGVQGYRGYQGLQGIKGTDGTNGDNGTNFVGCFTSSYSLYERNQYTTGTTYTFNKSDFNFLNVPLSQGDSILVIYSFDSNGVTYVEHCYIRLTRFRDDENTFTGVVWKWFKISDGIDGAQGATGIQGKQGLQGKNGTNGTNGTNGVQGFQGLQGISGALATNHWYLDKANPEVTNNSNSKIIQLDTSSDSIFAKLSDLINGPLNGRSFIVDWVGDSGSIITDLFGDLSTYRVPNQVRYHFYIRNASKRQGAVKIKWNPEFYTNVSHRPGFQPDIGLNYGECCKIEFVKFDDSHAWVDVELENLIYDASTAAASENNEDNATSQIMNYCDNNKLSYVLDKESNNLSFNMIDIIADICSKLK